MIDTGTDCCSSSEAARPARLGGGREDCEFRQSPHNDDPMKTNASFKIFKLPRLAPLGIAIAAALVTQPISATEANNVVLTHNSSMSLSATYNGSTSGNRVELRNSSLANFVTLGAPSSNQVTIVSDATSFFGGVPNGTTLPKVGTDSTNREIIPATLLDEAEVARVPDMGCTFGLLFLSLTALLGATRLRHVQLA